MADQVWATTLPVNPRFLFDLSSFLDREGVPEAAFIPKRQSPRYETFNPWNRSRNLCDCDRCGKGNKKVATKDKRWYKDVGLGFKTPAEAIQGTYIGASLYLLHVVWMIHCYVCSQTRSVPSPVTSQFVAVSWPVRSFQPRWRGQLWSAGITSIIFLNTVRQETSWLSIHA